MIRSTKVILAVIAMILPTSFLEVNAHCNCYDVLTDSTVDLSEIKYKSTDRYPQTAIHDIVADFLIDKNEGKQKKVLVLGYDGYREDALENIFGMEQSAVKRIAKEGGLFHSYAGANGNQDTSTAPGWLSILSGKWAYQLGVQDNTGRKDAGTATFLNDAVSAGYPSTFIASWAPHFDVTYQEDIMNAEGKAVYQQMDSDAETLETLQKALQDTSDSSYDVIFATLEYSDHAGHSIGYGNDVDEYVGASQQVDREGYKLLQAIYERDSYQEEDWLIIITTDHGGSGSDHGGQSSEEVNTWFAVNKDVMNILTESK